MNFKQQLVDKVLAGEKTVTRRPVKYAEVVNVFADGSNQITRSQNPCRYEVGKTYAVQPVIEEGPGKGRGGKEVARIRILSVSRETLLALNTRDARREGFYGAPEFATYWTKLYGSFDPNQLVDRIEFELVPGEQKGGGS